MSFQYDTLYSATLYDAYRTLFPWQWFYTIPHSP